MERRTVLLAGRNESLIARLTEILRSGVLALVQARDCESVLNALSHQPAPHLILIDTTLQGSADALGLARQILKERTSPPIILIAPNSSEELAIAALRVGVADYFRVPFGPDEIRASVFRLARVAPARGTSGASERDGAGEVKMIGESGAMRQVRGYLSKVASTDSNALITGETGTGKELAAATIHNLSTRRRRPFVHINCAAIPDTLLESELFGYERGAFTGASSFKEGTLKLADGGTVFFDEIGDMSPYAQAKMLRAIEAREVRRLGGKSAVALNIRIVAATNRDLSQLIAEGRFRSDLYFRLAVANVHLPPLRSRKEDLLELCHYYLHWMNERTGRDIEGFTQEAIASMLGYDWPGNVRELKNLIEAAFINNSTRLISLPDLPEHFRNRLTVATSAQGERERLLAALLATDWNKSQAAQKLQWSRVTLYRKMRKYRIESRSGAVSQVDSASPRYMYQRV
jgi:DNA-binding NtrC family response regulator